MAARPVRERLDTGDVVLFCGAGRVSSVIKRLTRSRWSHVGMVIRAQELDLLLLIESTTLSPLTDMDTGERRDGVQVVALSERLSRFDGEAIAVRRVLGPRTAEQVHQVAAVRQMFRGIAYESDQVELLRSAYDGPFGRNSRDLSTLFCSELVAEFWQVLRWLDAQVPSNEFTPANFAGEGDDAVDRYWIGTEHALGEVEPLCA